MNDELISAYYDSLIHAYGDVASRGVGWSSDTAQQVRFEKLCMLFEPGKKFSLLDYGCGRGDLLSYLDQYQFRCEYTGFDISKEMLAAARRRHPHGRFQDTPLNADYVVASGTFNLKFHTSSIQWKMHVYSEIFKIDTLSKRGFGFNLLEKANSPMLYEAFITDYIELCLQFGDVEYVEDYGQNDFTILVRKDA